MENTELQTSVFLGVLDSNLDILQNYNTIRNFILFMPLSDRVEMLLKLRYFLKQYEDEELT